MTAATSNQSNPRSWKRMVIKTLIIVAGAYVVLFVLGCAFQRKLVYFPTREFEATPADAGLEFRECEFVSPAGGAANVRRRYRLHGWYVPAEKARAAVLFCHGNAGNISHRIQTLRLLHDLGLAVLIFDYRGYGKSEGTPSENGTYRDSEAAWEYLTGELGWPPEKIIIFGRSLGTPIAARLASLKGPAGLVVESGFTSAGEIAQKLIPVLPVKWFTSFRYETEKYVSRAPCPVLVTHSREDELIPYEHGRRLFEAAPEPKRFLEMRGGHNEGAIVTGERYREAFEDFLETALGDRSERPGELGRP